MCVRKLERVSGLWIAWKAAQVPGVRKDSILRPGANVSHFWSSLHNGYYQGPWSQTERYTHAPTLAFPLTGYKPLGTSLKLLSLCLLNSLCSVKIIVSPGVAGEIKWYYTCKLLSKCCPKVSTQYKFTVTLSSFTPSPTYTCLCFLFSLSVFSLSVCVRQCLTSLYLQPSPGCAKSTSFLGSTFSPQQSTIFYQESCKTTLFSG